jgi:hypothetical protein
VTVICRAQVSPVCIHGASIPDTYPDGVSDDSTFDGRSVVCDACYIAVEPFMRMNSMNIPHAADEATEHYFVNLRWCQRHDNPAELVQDALSEAQKAAVGSPRRISSEALARMAQAEVDRRAKAPA